MTLKERLFLMFGKKYIAIEEAYGKNLGISVAYQKIAIESAISLIANTLASAEVQTFLKGKKIRSSNYYAFNVQPNSNQNANEFYRQLISKLFKNNEALVVLVNDQYFVADSFNHEKRALIDDVYTDIVIRDYQLNKVFLEHEVLYFKFQDEDIKEIIDNLYSDYANLLSYSMNHYRKSKGRKGILKISTMISQRPDFEKKLQDLMQKKFKTYFESDNAVLPLQDGFEYDEADQGKVKNDSRDIKALINDIYDFVGSAFHIPSGLLRGDTVGLGDQIDSFLMFCIKPLANLLQDEINRKIYSKEEYLERTYLKFDLKKIKLIDIQKIASTSDLLLRNGSHSINDNLEMLDLEPKTEKWASEHYMTKNYQTVLGDNLIDDKTKKGKYKNE